MIVQKSYYFVQNPNAFLFKIRIKIVQKADVYNMIIRASIELNIMPFLYEKSAKYVGVKIM